MGANIKLFPTLEKMNYLKKLTLYSIIAVFFGCSSEKTMNPEVSSDEPLDLENIQENLKVELIAIAPEDRVIADSAPAGMVFIKGGCFILGNNFAQVDENVPKKCKSVIFGVPKCSYMSI